MFYRPETGFSNPLIALNKSEVVQNARIAKTRKCQHLSSAILTLFQPFCTLSGIFVQLFLLVTPWKALRCPKVPGDASNAPSRRHSNTPSPEAARKRPDSHGAPVIFPGCHIARRTYLGTRCVLSRVAGAGPRARTPSRRFEGWSPKRPVFCETGL